MSHPGNSRLPGRAELAMSLALESESGQFVLVIGDSISEGLGLANWRDRWMHLTERAVNRQLDPTARIANGYIPAVWGGGEWMREAVRTQDATAGEDHGLGRRHQVLQDGGWVEWADVEADELRLHWTSSPEGGTISVLIDRVEVARTDTRAEGRPRSRMTTIRHACAGAEVRIVAESEVSVEGLTQLFDSSACQFIDGTHSGYRADLYIDSDGASSHWEAAAHYQPAMILCVLGANDLAGNFDIPIPAEEWASNLSMLVETALQHCPDAGFHFYNWTERTEDKGNTRHAEYEAAALAAIGDHPRVSFTSLGALLPPGSDDSLGWHASEGEDTVHPNERGHRALARVVVDSLRLALVNVN